MSYRIIIPARYGSTRFPGKPLAVVSGVPLLQRVWAIGVSVTGQENVIIATDDERIANFCKKIGARYVLTDPALPNGTARTHAALGLLHENVSHIINLQGDAVLTPPWVVLALLEAMQTTPPGADTPGIFTPAVKMDRASLESLRRAKIMGEVGGTTVTFDKSFNALYFSKSIIPYVREAGAATVFRHIGIYGYKNETLGQLIALPPSPLEEAEKLEQLRALENGLKIRVVPVDYHGRSHTGIDSETDLQRAERIIAAEGELLASYDGSITYKA